MTTEIGSGRDRVFLDDFLMKEGTLGKWEKRLPSESPSDWYYDWEPADPSSTFTADCDSWRAHYRSGYPLVFYCDKKFAFGVRKSESSIKIEYNTDDIIWAEMDGRVILERGDFPRFTTKDLVKFSHTPKATEYPNVFRLDNGYSISCNKKVYPVEYGAYTEGEAWWMIGKTEDESELSRRVLKVKIYDGPYKYQARGTDIRISDPSPLDRESEYTIYSYDEDGLRGLYKENYTGVSPQKYAITLRGDDLVNQIVESEGDYKLIEGQLVGRCKLVYSLPLNATKLLNIYVRGSELEYRIRPDEEDWVSFDNYDGKAVSDLDIEIGMYNSLSSIRIEWESVKNWTPVGRPRIDIIPADWGGNQLRITSDEGEGLVQTVPLSTGAYTVSANVKCLDREPDTNTITGEFVRGKPVEGYALIDVGGIEIASWNPYDKNIRGFGDFVSNNDQYEITLTSRGRACYTIDRMRIAEAGQNEWLPEDIKWSIETDDSEFDIKDSINIPNVPVSVGEAKRWRLKAEAPDNIGQIDHIAVSSIQTDSYQTGDYTILKHLRWSGNGKSRIYLPTNIINSPVNSDWVDVYGFGAISWEQENRKDDGDVHINIDGSEFTIYDEYSHRNFTLLNRRWRVDVEEYESKVFLDGEWVAHLEGNALPFKTVHHNSEDIQVDSPQGLIQIRRDVGPRFEGWRLIYSKVPYVVSNAKCVFGITDQEARDNIPFYIVKSN